MEMVEILYRGWHGGVVRPSENRLMWTTCAEIALYHFQECRLRSAGFNQPGLLTPSVVKWVIWRPLKERPL